MKILRLEIESVKRILAARIEPDGNAVVIGGKNGAGKSSVLDSIAYALGGKALIPSRPIRAGETHARVEVDLGELVVERTWTEKGSYLKVRNADGFEAASPQAVLDKLVGRLSFDPLAFTEMAPRQQVEALKELVGLDFSGLDEERATLYAQRTEVGREVKRLEGRLSGLPEVDDPGQAVSIADLMSELRSAQQHNAALDELVRKRDQAEDDSERAEERAQIVREQLELLQQQLAEWERKGAAAAAVVASCNEDIVAFDKADTQALEEQIAAADEINARYRQHQEREQVAQHLDDYRAHVRQYTDRIAALDDQRAKALAEAEFPVEGLAFDADQVLFDGLPFDQASHAEQLRVSVAMGLAANPELRILLVRDGSLLDEGNLALVGEMAAAADAQVWIERVGDGPEVSVLIEDGEVAAVRPKLELVPDDQ